MPEYIEREALMEELAAIQSATYMSTCLTKDECKGKRWMIARAIDAVKAAPAADVARVVRCKDCCYWNRKYTTVGECEKLADRDQEGGAQFDCDTEDDDFCSYGKRKDGAE